MKTTITDLKLYLVNRGTTVDWGTGSGPNWAFIKVYTDGGITGVGEAFHSLDEPIEGSLVKYKRWLIGKDATEVIRNWQAIYRGLRYPLGTAELAALSAVEHALWDITGKVAGLPVYKLLGGPVRDRIRLYANPNSFSHMVDGEKPQGTGFFGDDAVLAARAKATVDAGFTAIKFAPQPDDFAEKLPQVVLRESVERVKTVRKAIGDRADLALDYHGRSFSPADSIQLAAAIEECHPLFLEEPAISDSVDALVEIKSKTRIPIAAGERAVTRQLMHALIHKQAVHIIQPEPTANGGIWETIKLAGMAELVNIMVAPHFAAGAIALTVCGHIDAVLPNFIIQEYNDSVLPESQVTRDVIINLPVIEDGHLILSVRPGLGIDFDEEAAADYHHKPYDRPVLIAPDGSIALE